MKKFIVVFLLIMGLAFIFLYKNLLVISGYAAKEMCSNIFIAKRAEIDILEQDLNLPFIKYANTSINYKQNFTEASVFGLANKRAYYRKDLGCYLSDIGKSKLNSIKKTVPENITYLIQQDSVKGVDHTQLKKIVDDAFDNTLQKKNTRALIILKKNFIIAERYAQGITAETKLLGWSMTKSIFNAYVGALVYKNKVDIHKPISMLQNKNINLKSLLQMNSGLKWTENYNIYSNVTKMLFFEEDMCKNATNATVETPNTNKWYYSSGGTNILSGVLKKTIPHYHRFLYDSLFYAIGMNSAIIETDYVGNFVASSYAWMKARDWAKFGLLYLNKGKVLNKRIFSEQWYRFTTTETKGSNGKYGALFWLNKNGLVKNAPKDMFMCIGHNGQRIFIIPSKQLVIVRLGCTQKKNFNFSKFVSEIFACIQ